MAITYDLVYKNNRRIPISGPCFGGFSDEGSYPSHSIRSQFARSRGLENAEMRELHRTPQDASFFQFYAEPYSDYWKEGNEEKAVWQRRYFDEMKALIADIPWLEASVHPLLGVIRVPVEGKPADKVMMTLFLVRNLAHYEYATGYRYLRKMGMKPFAAAIFSSFWKKGKGNTFTPGTWYYNTVGEYNWLSPYTCGRESLRALVTAGADFNPWVQGVWGDQGGYRRDRFWNGSAGHSNIQHFNPVLDENGTPRMSSRIDNPSHYRRLIDCLSVKGDVPMFSNVQAEWTSDDRGTTNRYLRWAPAHPHHSNPAYSEADHMAIINEFIALCREFGYEPMLVTE